MKLDQLIIKTIIVQVLLIITKIIFFRLLNVEFWPILISYYLVLAVVCIATVRRLGVINYFESFLTAIIWLVLSIFIDLMITQVIINNGVFSNGYFLLSYLVLPLILILFHKKLHVETRRSLKK